MIFETEEKVEVAKILPTYFEVSNERKIAFLNIMKDWIENQLKEIEQDEEETYNKRLAEAEDRDRDEQ